MGKLIRHMLIGAGVFLCVGIVLGLIAPTVAGLLGAAAGAHAAAVPGLFGAHLLSSELFAGIVSHAAVPTLWTGIYFGLFGAVVPPIQRAFDAVFGDEAAKAASLQRKENVLLETRCNEIEGREIALEQEVTGGRRAYGGILSRGALGGSQSFAAAEEARAASASSRTVH